MEQSIKIETGAQLLARLTQRPSLEGLERILFLDGPREGEVIEISGDLSSGKTLLVTQLLAKCLLPRKYNDFYLNGMGAGAVLVNTDHHFQISMLVNLMTHYIHDVITTGNITCSKNLNDGIVEGIIAEALNYLTVVNCYDSAQFLLGLESLPTILSNDNKIAIVIVDSVSSYYWHDRENGGIWSMDGYLRNCLKLMQKYISYHKVLLVYTRPSEFESKGKEVVDCAPLPEEEKVNYRIRLRMLKETSKFNAVVESALDKRNISYSISHNGIVWRTNDVK